MQQDSSAFTIADGLVQHMLSTYLFHPSKFLGVVGEEDTPVNIETEPYTVDSLPIPAELYREIDAMKESILLLSHEIDGAAYKDLTIFIDPIDGTRGE